MNIFIILLPFIDLITSLTTRLFNFSISLGIIIKSLFLLYMLYYISFKTFSKYKKIGLFYIAFIFIYIIGYFVTKINYITLGNIKNELTYIVKLIYYPTLLPSLCCFFDDFKYSKKEISNLMLINLILYTIFLIIPLITKSGFDSYPNRLGGTIGWFYSANELSAILIMLFPFIYKVLNKNKFFVILPFIIILTISTIGTKASMIGLLIDSLILLIISLFSKKNKNRNWLFIILASLIFSFNIFVFYNSKSFSNLKTSIDIQEQENINEEKEDLEDLLKELESNNNSKLNKFMDKYGKAILSDRDIYFKITYLLYRKNYNINTLLFGVGYTNNKAINSKAIEKLIEIDPLDIYFHSGLIAIIIILLPFIYYLFKFIKNKKLNINIFFYTLMLGMIFCVSFISGHTLMAPAVSFYIVLYLILGYIELGFMNFDETKKIKKGKVSIYSLHLNFGGIERDICNKANILSKIYDVEIISVYKLNKEPFFKVDDKVSIKYLTNVIPNKLEFKEAKRRILFFKSFKY